MIYFRPHVRALERQIDDLKQQLSESEGERRELLDRLLEKNNYQPIRQSAAESTSQEKIVQLISPFNSVPLEAQDAIKESWLKEETEYIMATQGIESYDRARAVAESNWEAHNRPIN